MKLNNFLTYFLFFVYLNLLEYFAMEKLLFLYPIFYSMNQLFSQKYSFHLNLYLLKLLQHLKKPSVVNFSHIISFLSARPLSFFIPLLKSSLYSIHINTVLIFDYFYIFHSNQFEIFLTNFKYFYFIQFIFF